MSERDDGGPAFPYGGIHIEGKKLDGMSLRDYFAAAALPAIIALTGAEGNISIDVSVAYDYADAMLAKRAK